MVAVAYPPKLQEPTEHEVCIFDLPSRSFLGPLIVSDGKLVAPIWTHDEYLRFATINQRSITIREVEFTLKHPPTQVESFAIPDEAVEGDHFLFFPAQSRLAFTLDKSIQVWDLKASKLLLLKSGAKDNFGPSSTYSFSSDSHFFAFVTTAREVHIWKESPVGYVLHQQFPPLLIDLKWLRLSPDGGSIISPLDDTINLWHAGDQIPSLPIPPAEERSDHHFILTFSPDEKSAAFTQASGNVVTILDLKSGNLRSTIDTGMEVECLGVAGDTVIVVDMEKIVTWNLPGGDHEFNASINDSILAVMLHPQLESIRLPLAGLRIPLNPIPSLSPDLSCIAVKGKPEGGHGARLNIYDVSTGTCLASTALSGHIFSLPVFTRDGREVWMALRVDKPTGWAIIKDDESKAMELKLLRGETLYPSRTLLWHSPHGYKVTDDGWVLSPTRKRLLWLPHRWRSDREEYRLWSGRFLGLSHRLSDVVIVEFFE